MDVKNIQEHLAPLVVPDTEDELAKRFDNLIFSIELAQVIGKNFTKAKDSVIRTADSLSEIGTIPQVLAKKDIIQKVKTEDFWAEVDIFDLELVREALRDLIKFIEKEHTQIYYTNFTDEILSVFENPGEYGSNNLQNYRKKVNQYLREHQNHISIHKLKNNKPLSKQDFLALEKILWNEIGSKDDYEKEFGDTPLTILVRQTVGLEQEAAHKAFSEFLNDRNLDSKQIRFVKTIIDYIIKNGHMLNKAVLQEEPFQSIGSITDVFEMDKALKIVGIIDKINKNATEVLGA